MFEKKKMKKNSIFPVVLRHIITSFFKYQHASRNKFCNSRYFYNFICETNNGHTLYSGSQLLSFTELYEGLENIQHNHVLRRIKRSMHWHDGKRFDGIKSETRDYFISLLMCFWEYSVFSYVASKHSLYIYI